ncbi:MAG: hypothetical protein ACFFCP_13705 [Promethearchaeota archaeon]
MNRTLYDILDGWIWIWDDEEFEVTLHQVSESFHVKKIRFLLIDKIMDAVGLGAEDGDYSSMTEGQKMYRIEKLLQDEEVKQVAKFVQLDLSGPPDYQMTVKNVEEIKAQFPSWFEEFTGITWAEFGSRLIKD